ncbi:hypothetical protein N824_01655 [Pedobacter sp. V48]|nr:hypothetical protein N824_01655 [Pedobacter sp. V48]
MIKVMPIEKTLPLAGFFIWGTNADTVVPIRIEA